jgi:hypothetical protein
VAFFSFFCNHSNLVIILIGISAYSSDKRYKVEMQLPF